MRDILRLDQVRVVQLLHQQACVAIIGPRQVGKTALARQIADNRPGSLYLDLEAREDREKLAEPVLFLRQYQDNLSYWTRSTVFRNCSVLCAASSIRAGARGAA